MHSDNERFLRAACLPVGIQWHEGALSQFEIFQKGIASDVSLTTYPICRTEKDASKLVKQIEVDSLSGKEYDCLILAVIQGSTVRRALIATGASKVPVILWCHNQNHSLASASLIREGLRQIGVPAILIHEASEEEIREGINAIKSAGAFSRLQKYTVGKLGELHHNLLGSETTPIGVFKRFGTWTKPISFSEFIDEYEKIDDKETADIIEELRVDYNVDVPQDLLDKAARVHRSFQCLSQKHGVAAFAVDCWNDFLPLLGITPCIGFAFNNYDIACERDVLAAILMKTGKVITGSTGYFGDFSSFDRDTGVVKSKHCGGNMNLHRGSTKASIVADEPPGPISKKGVVLSCRPYLEEGPCTIALLHGENGANLFISRGKIIKTDYKYQMNVSFTMEGDPKKIIRNSAGNHYFTFPGRFYDAFALWAEWTGLSIDLVE